MDKAAIKTFAINSRRKLMEDAVYRMSLIGVSKDGIQDSITDAEGIQTFNIGGAPYSIYDEDIKKRENLIKEVENKGFENVVEEVAYTWFNRIIAIRYMEVNDYLPTRTRVLSSETPGKIEPDIITRALDLDLDYADEDKKHIFKLKDESKLDELFRFLFIKQCNKLNEILPGLFEKTEDFMELLLNISFVSGDGVVRNLVDTIPEEDFTNQVEIIGWLYQFYNTELKDDTFANLKKKIKISKERIPAATQLFTPDWIVKYMVENSLGRLWLEGHPNDDLKSNWKYFVDEAEQEPEVELKLDEIRKESAVLRPEDIKVIDPCMGSGHILVYVFDVLMQIYVSEGFTEKDATESILRNNIYGLDIDDRAYQLAYFAVLMKARQYNGGVLQKGINPLLYSIQESNSISEEFKNYIISKDSSIKDDLEYILKSFKDAKEYGSILDIKSCAFEKIIELILSYKENSADLNKFKYLNEFNLLENIVFQAMFLSLKYDVVITNPPYMGASGMNQNLRRYLKSHFPNSKTDLYAVFIEKCNQISKDYGLLAMITQQSFMFLSTFKKLRKKLINNSTIIEMVHLGARAFDGIGGEVVQATTFILRKGLIKNYYSTFHKLTDFNSEQSKNLQFFNDNNKFVKSQSNFNGIPGEPIAFWVSDDLINAFQIGQNLSEVADIKSGLSTGDNNRFLRYWFEVSHLKTDFHCKNLNESKFSNAKWFPLNKGGNFRKWYGNQEYVINFENDGYELKNFKKFAFGNSEFHFLNSISWSRVSSGRISFRFYPNGFLFDNTGSSLFINNKKKWYIFGFLNSSVCQSMLDLIAPTLHYEVGNISSLSILYYDHHFNIDEIVKNCINIVKEDWDSYELSWNFKKHPFLTFANDSMCNAFENWRLYKNSQFNLLKENEIKLNEIFANIYSLTIDSDVEDKHISVSLANYEKDIKSFISYAVGCMFGRYGLDFDGIQFAGGKFDINKYSKFIPDDDNIIPLLDTEYFEDDIVGRLIEFVKTCFGEETLEENLDFIAGALSKSNKTSREIIRDYLLKNFFKDHVQTYKKCPIYWMFSSGKQNGFNCLVYMHRYEPSLVARVRTEYLHKTQKKIEENVARCDNIINNSNVASEKSKATKEKNKLIKQLEETREYDVALAYIANQNIEIDLDDGVKVNYAKFQNVEVSKEGQKTKKIDLLKKI